MKSLLLRRKSGWKRKSLICFLVVLFVCLCADMYAQRVVYAYDDAGNRISRQKEIILQSSSDPSLRSSTDSEEFEETLLDLKISIYPNPTQWTFPLNL